MSDELDARLLRGALTTVRKALQVSGLDDPQELDLYAPIIMPVVQNQSSDSEPAPVESDNTSDRVVAFTGSAAGEGSENLHPASIGRKANSKTADGQDERINSDETAAELFGSMPWESSESGEQASEPDAAANPTETKISDAQRSLDESAEALFSSSLWESVSSGASSDQTEDATGPPAGEVSGTDLSTEETAEDLFAAMPWESNASRSSSAGAEAPTQSGAARDENEAGAFLLDMPWEESSEPAEEAAARAHSKHDTNSGSNESDAQDFFENLDWDGAAQSSEKTDESEENDASSSDDHVSIDPDDSEDLPEHVRRIMGMRESEQVPTPTDDAVRRSGLSDAGESSNASDSSDVYDPFTGDNT